MPCGNARQAAVEEAAPQKKGLTIAFALFSVCEILGM